MYILYNSVEVLHSLHFAHAESYLMQVPSDFFYNECWLEKLQQISFVYSLSVGTFKTSVEIATDLPQLPLSGRVY